MNKIENKGIYIKNLEASDIYCNNYRNQDIKTDYTGMIPFSLLSMKLDKLKGFSKQKVNAKFDEFGNESFKYISRDIVNVKFNYGVTEISKFIDKKKEQIGSIELNINELQDEIKLLENEKKVVTYNDISPFEDDECATPENETKSIPLTEAARKRKIKINLNKIKQKQKQKVSIENLIKQLEALMNDVTLSDEYKEQIFKKVSTGDLRKMFYKDGFSLTHLEGDTEVTTKYKLFTRSSSKARNGEVTFINEELYDEMIQWVRMGYTFGEDEVTDVTGVRAYESLVGSSIIDTIKINPNSILVISDVQSTFKKDVNIIKKGLDGKLESFFEEDAQLSNDIWDGQSLMCSSFFEGKDYSFMLLRNHMFKSAGFSFDLQKFFKDNLPDGETLDTWMIKDIFGNKRKASEIKLITTPNSLKFLKFAYMETPNQSYEEYAKLPEKAKKKAEKAIYAHWCKLVKKQEFGICKYEKPSQFDDVNGNRVQQLSYQMINTLLGDKEDIGSLSALEVKYINDLNTDFKVFIDYLENTKSDENTNELYINLYKMNNEFANTHMFSQFRSKVVYGYKQNLKQGKIKLESSDYAVMVSCPIQMAYHAIGLLDTETLEIKTDKPITVLKENEVYSKLFEFSTDEKIKKIVAHRNPHSSFSNTCLFVNVHNQAIEDYMPNMSKNVIVVNTIDSDIMERLSGCDFDSDSIHVTDNPVMKDLAEKAIEYKTCINQIPIAKKADYTLDAYDLAKLDEAIAISGKKVGECANVCQFGVSTYMHFKYLLDNKSDQANKKQIEFWKKCKEDSKKYIDISIALSTVCIDSAKKSFDISLSSEINTMRNAINAMYRNGLNEEKDKVVYKPLFFQIVERDKNNKLKAKGKKSKTVYTQYHTPMDYLQDIVKNIKSAPNHEKTALFQLINEVDINKGNRNQYDKLLAISNELNTFHAKKKSKNDDESWDILFQNHINAIKKEVSKLKIKKENIYKLMQETYDEKDNHNKLLKFISVYHREEYSKLFVKNS